MNIGFIGAGKVGTAFGVYLKRNNFNVTGYCSRSASSLEEAVKLTGSERFESYDSLVKASDLIFITTQDGLIASVCDDVAKSSQTLKNKTVAHMSGALSSEVLSSARKKGAYIFSVHPLQAFADIQKSVQDLEKTYFGIEGEKRIDIVKSMLGTTGNRFFILKPEQKSKYHITACIVSNFLVALLDYGLDVFDSIGIDKDDGFKALLPMISGTVDNIHKLGTEDALTGPIARGDISTIENHMISLVNDKDSFLKTYAFLGKMTLELARKKKLEDEASIKELSRLLSIEGTDF